MSTELVPANIPIEFAIELLRKAAWLEHDENEDADKQQPIKERRHLIHTRAGGFGADWNLDTAIEFVQDSDQRYFFSGLMGRCLVVVSGGRSVVFDDVHAPVIEDPRTPCERGEHPRSTWAGPGRWRCLTCVMVWYGPSY